jgi:GH24 family phage-related lysozyme (muramidase)
VNDHSNLKQLLIQNEGSIGHMYLDTVGRVTVGIGHMIPSCVEAEKLSFILRNSGMNASVAQIMAEYSALQKQTPGLPAAHYQTCTQLDMAASVINALLDADIRTTETGVRTAFRGYDTYPAEAQDALLDMAFNLGVNGLVNKFPHLKAAAEAGNWEVCAEQCRRNGISDARNDKTKALFQTAANHRTASATV